MLEPWIIEEIRRREDERNREREALRIEIPRYEEPPRRNVHLEDDEPQRGVVVIDL